MGYVGPASAEGSGSFSTVQNLIKPFVGAGILALPKVWSDGGILLSSGLLLVLAYVALWAIFCLVQCSDDMMLAEARRNARQRLAAQSPSSPSSSSGSLSSAPAPTSYASNDEFSAAVVPLFDANVFDDSLISAADRAAVPLPTFTEVGRAAFGYWGAFAVDVSILITQMGACIAYIVFMSKNFSQVIGLAAPIWVGIMFIPLALLSTIRKMEKLAPFSAMGNIVYIFTIIVIMIQGVRANNMVPRDDIVWSDFSFLPLIFGTVSFALEGIALILPIKNRMKQPADFRKLMVIAMIVVTLLYLGFSIFGYVLFRDVKSPIISSLPDDWLTDTVKISLSIAIFFTFVLQTFPAALFFDEVIDAKLGISMAELKAAKIREREMLTASGAVLGSDDNPADDLDSPEVLVPHLAGRRFALQNMARFLFVAFVCIVGIIFPDFKLIVSLFGSLSNAMLAYVFPALFWIKICSSVPLYGVIYFPFSRTGEPAHNPFLPADDGETLLGEEGDSESASGVSARAAAHNKHRQINAEDVQVEKPVAVMSPTTAQKAKWIVFPIVVAVLGIIASIIGVTDAIRDLVKEFSS